MLIPFAKNYDIDEHGNVFSFHLNKIMRCNTLVTGYKRIGIVCDDGKKKRFLVHRLVALTYLPNPENKEEVNHKDGNKLNNHVSNLEWVTRHENMRHAFSTGLNSNKGVMNGKCILTTDQVIEIYYKLQQGARNSDVAKEYGICRTTVFSIKKKRIWQEILDYLPDIKIKSKAERLSEKTARWICEKLQEGVGPKQILDMCHNPSVNIDHIYDIKRRRGFKHISKDYKW